MKKLASILLALVMLISCIPAMAEGDSVTVDYLITINNPNNDHTYQAYQIFTGDLKPAVYGEEVGSTTSNTDENTSTITNSTKAILSDIEWGEGVQSDALLTALKNNNAFIVNEKNIFAECSSAEDVANALVEHSSLVNAFAKVVNANLSSVTTGTFMDKGTYYQSSVPAGYYLIKDQDGTLNDKQDAYTEFIIEVIEDSTVVPKSSVPTVQKKVKDINNSTETTLSDWQDSADHDINDKVHFQLTGTLPGNYASYTTYTYVFHDKQSAGLTFNKDSVKVYVDQTEIQDGFTVVTEDLSDQCTFEVRFANLKDLSGVSASSKIIVKYTATLNENAILGAPGNPNEVYLEFSNNPNWEGTGAEGETPDTGKTPVDKVIVFTYKTVVNKVDSEHKPLNGASFELLKQTGKDTEDKPVWTSLGVVSGEERNIFEWKGLDDGLYKLVETVTPSGYNSIDPIEFTITAEHEVLSDDPALTSLNGKVITGEITFAVESNAGSLSTDIVNKSGATLPETGGMGTTLLYVGGGILVLAAIVLLIVKRRASAE